MVVTRGDIDPTAATESSNEPRDEDDQRGGGRDVPLEIILQENESKSRSCVSRLNLYLGKVYQVFTHRN